MMDLGQVMDYIVEYANSETEANERSKSGETLVKRANQADFDAF